MRLSGLVIASVLLVLIPSSVTPALAQHQPPSEQMLVSGKSAATWSVGATDVLQVEGPVTIDFDRASLSAGRAVIWLSPDPAVPAGGKRVQIALVGDAKVRQGDNVRSGASMIVTAEVSGRIQLRADDRTTADLTDSDLYRAAQAMRNPAAIAPPPPVAPQPPAVPLVTPPLAPTQPAAPVWPAIPAERPVATLPTTRRDPLAPTRPTTAATLPAGPPPQFYPGQVQLPQPVNFQAKSVETVQTPDGTVAILLSGDVLLRQRRPNEDYVVLRADRAVLFTPLKELREAQEKGGRQIVDGAYLEGDVRVVFTPAATANNEQRLEGNRVYYEFATDRAVLTDAIMRTVDAKTNFTITARARMIRQLAQGEFRADGVKLSTSQFASPSYSVQAGRIYVRKEEAEGDDAPRTLFSSTNTTFRAFDVPLFYLPYVGGSMSDFQTPVRGLGVEHTQAFGTSFIGEFGLLELLGQEPMRDLDLALRTDYHSDRGPALGLNANYQGGFVTPTNKEPWNFEGKFRSYFVYDHGFDDIGRPVQDPDPKGESEIRGRVLWEHTHILPDDWMFQGRAGYVTDQRFLEQWFPRTFENELPHDVSLYLKRQRDTEAFTLLLQFQPNDLVTTADLIQEQFEVEHIPEIGYRRIGDSVANDSMTFFSQNTLAGMRFQPTRATLPEQGFVPGLSPGLPSLGYTGVTDDTVYRGDFRQELNYPIAAGPVKLVPYVVGRYTAYSDSPTDGTQNRLFGAVGAKLATAFWRVDDSVHSDFWDLNRLRHVIEPEINVFSCAQTVDRNDVYIFEEPVDGISDVTAAQIALHQRWQTYRGGPGKWRSVDYFTLNLEANLFANQPSRDQLRPLGFRGLFYPSMPEASVPRNALNADATWRVADNTAILADVTYNLDEDEWSTGAVGLVARRGEKISYYLGLRYINELSSNIGTVAIDYELTRKYFVSLRQSYDFGQGENVISEISLVRRFDTFAMVFHANRNERADESGFGISIVPNGIGYGVDTGQFATALNGETAIGLSPATRRSRIPATARR